MFIRPPTVGQNEGIFQNIGKTQRDGVELTARHRESRWEAGVSYSYLKARYRSAVELPSWKIYKRRICEFRLSYDNPGKTSSGTR